MEEIINNVNWLAVFVGFIVSFILGWLWYSPKMFGEKWALGVGLEAGSAASMPMGAMITQALGTFLLAWIVGVTAANDALLTIVLIVVAIMVLQISSGLFTNKKRAAILIDAGFILVMAMVMIVFQGVF